jgi:hypothetical protein
MTPDPNSLLVAVAFAVGQGVTDILGNLTIADSQGHVWTPRVSANDADWGDGVRIYTAPNTPGTAFTIDLDCGALDVHHYWIDVFSYTGQHDATPTGATGSASDQAGDGPVSCTLSSAPAATSEVVAAAVTVITGDSAILHGTGWAEIADSFESSWLGLQTQVRTGSTSPSVGWDDIYVGVGSSSGAGLVALEIVAADGGGVSESFSGSTIVFPRAMARLRG